MKSLVFDGLTIYENGTVIGQRGHSLKPWDNGHGYLFVRGKSGKYRVHRLVARLLPDYSEALEVNHKDGNKVNNHISNLEMTTRSGNLKHAWDTGLQKSTESRSMKISTRVSKLVDKADEIRSLYASGEYSSRELGRMFSVDKKTIMNLVHKRHY